MKARDKSQGTCEGEQCSSKGEAEVQLTYDAIQRRSELMRHHGHEFLLGLHAHFEILNLLQPAALAMASASISLCVCDEYRRAMEGKGCCCRLYKV